RAAAMNATGSNAHRGLPDSDSRNARRLASMLLNSAIPGTSTRLTAVRTTASRDGAAPSMPRPGVASAGNQRQASRRPTTVIGTLTRKIAGQPARSARNPPSTGPSATLTDEVMLIAPSVPAGAWPWGLTERMMASPAGYAAEVP